MSENDESWLSYWLMRRLHWTAAELDKAVAVFGSIRALALLVWREAGGQ